MSIILDEIDLIKRVEDPQTRTIRQIRNVYNIDTREFRTIIEHKILGSNESMVQNMGKEPLQVFFEGIFMGENAKDDLQQIWSRYNEGLPVSFSSDITSIAELEKVIIEYFVIKNEGGYQDTYHYSIVLREYREPRYQRPQPPPSQDEEAQQEVEEQTDEATESINYITGKVLDSKGNPKKNVEVIIKKDEDEEEYKISTNEEGIYRQDDLSPGKYKVKVNAKGYEDLEEIVEIGEGS